MLWKRLIFVREPNKNCLKEKKYIVNAHWRIKHQIKQKWKGNVWNRNRKMKSCKNSINTPWVNEMENVKIENEKRKIEDLTQPKSSSRRKKEWKALFKEIKAEKFPEPEKDIHLHI